MSSHKHPPNRLAQETSPYLLQHARNPVDWFPWGEEAFAKAQQEDKPIFLSVGYSACHWCHVMERESFENESIARLLNEKFVCIKVDREERPDIDQIYMTAVQLITQRGGWPMSVFMTPQGQPFYGGTYWPPTARMGMPGFMDLVVKLHEYWVHRREDVVTSAGELVAAIGRLSAADHGLAGLDESLLERAMHQLIRVADRREGGFGSAPKFPHPMDLRVLFRCWKRFHSQDALGVVRLTLEKMAAGGIYDHLGGGFHRYSTDAHWLVPHFEKMLYDNALLVPAYLELYQITQEPMFATVVRETLDYLLREMNQPGGGFYSTQDADSEGEEGKFFVWTAQEIDSILGTEEARVFNLCYDVTTGGNWEGHTILHRPRPLSEIAPVLNLDEATLAQRLAGHRRKLFEARELRVKPGRDDKILTSWNGMLIAALAQAANVLGEDRYRIAAIEAATFVWGHMRNAEGRLLHSFKDGRARFNAYLDDYACVIDGLTSLYEATADSRYIDWALTLVSQMLEFYADSDGGGFFYTPSDHEQLITRTKDSQDNATPSGNGMAATALLRLGQLCSRPDLTAAGVQTLNMLSGLLAEHPRAAGQALLALDFHLGPCPEIVLVDGAENASSQEMLAQVHRRYLPNRLLVHQRTKDHPSTALAAHFEGRPAQNQTQCYVCVGGACLAPMTSAAELATALDSLA